MVQISLQYSGGKVVFLGWFHGTPPGTNGSESTLVTFSVNMILPLAGELVRLSLEWCSWLKRVLIKLRVILSEIILLL